MVLPERLLTFLLTLERLKRTEDVWNAILCFARSIELDHVDYVFATDFRNWEKAQFIRTTMHSRWFDFIKQFPHIRHTSNFRMHGVKYLTPMKIGPVYFDDMGTISEDKRRHVVLAGEMGFEAGVALPLRTGEIGQAAMIALAGRHSREGFDRIWAEHGWTIHVAMMSAHLRHTELFKAEFSERNELTEKHQELIRLVGEGLMDKQIAEALNISFSAVRQRLISVQKKIGVQNRADLAAVAARMGLVADPLLKGHGDALTVFLSTGDGETGVEMPQGIDAN